MDDLYLEQEIPWYLKDRSKAVVPPRGYRDRKPNLYYCNSCEKVWEKNHNGETLKYTDLPTYGLNRECCHYCTDD